MLNNEQVGISAEVAIADVFNVAISASYCARGDIAITEAIKSIIPEAFSKYNIPAPVQHTAEGQNVVDFVLGGNKTLSVKTNKQKLGKVAPQKIGQASSNTWFGQLAEKLDIPHIPTSYEEKVELFKLIVLTQIDKLLAIYWDHTFSCDYLLHIYDVVDNNDVPTNHPKYVAFTKQSSPIWDPNKITFTKPSVSAWNESNTVKYGDNGVPIGEFQVHNNRDNFKFRFNMQGIVKLIAENGLHFS